VLWRLITRAAPKGAESSTGMNHPFGVSYVHPHWLIVTTDGLPMPTTNRGIRSAAGFFVKIVGASQYVDDNRQMDPIRV
jgi:hypothetical protein